MHIFKTVLASAAAALMLLPWNATAVDRDHHGLAQLLSDTLGLGSSKPEEMLVRSLLQVGQGQLQQASDTIDELLKVTPNFKLAQLVRGDLLMARAQQFQAFGNPNSADAQRVSDFQEEARKRIARHLSQPRPDSLPEPLWQLDSKQPYVLVVDTDKSRLYVYRNDNGTPRYLADYYATIGKNGSEKQVAGDKRTPVGVYFAASKLTRKLDDLYGEAAYPLSYPNEWDKRQGKSGSGIWLHGTPSNTYSRPPRASDGCVVLANPDMKALEPILKGGNVPVIIANNLQWISPQNVNAGGNGLQKIAYTPAAASPLAAPISQASASESDYAQPFTPQQLLAQKQQLMQSLQGWRQDWQLQDTDSYLGYYSLHFASGKLNYASWAAEKRRIQAAKPKVNITLSNVSIFRYPSNSVPMAVVTFDQSYKTSTLDSQMRKRQYWAYENQRWKIIFEGSV